MLALESVTRLLLATRADEDRLMAGVAAVAFAMSVAALVVAIRLQRKKQLGLAVALYVVAAVALFGCCGISSLLTLAQFAWH